MPGPAAPSPASGPRRATPADRLVDGVLRALLRAALAMPYERRVPFMGAVLRHAAGPLAGYRRRALENLALIRPEWTAGRRREVATAALDNLGRTLIENYSHRDLALRLAGTEPVGGGLAHLRRARAEGRPVIFVTGHFGNHEAPRHVLARMGHEVGGLYRRMENPLVDAHYAATMTAVSGPVFARGRQGTLGFVRHLKAGGMATILFDLHAAEGTPIPFLGRPALTATTAADLAIRLDALVLPYFGIRRADGLSFEVALEEPVAPAAPARMMAEMTRRLEARVERDPGQWFWVHRRWKGARPGAGLGAGSAAEAAPSGAPPRP